MAKIILKCKDEDYNDITKAVEITFINQRMTNAFSKLVSDITKIQLLNGKITKIKQEHGEVMIDKDKTKGEKRDEILELDKQLKETQEEFANACQVAITNDRSDLVQLILKANHVQDAELTDKEWWDDFVEPADTNEFIANCIYKDKKKA